MDRRAFLAVAAAAVGGCSQLTGSTATPTTTATETPEPQTAVEVKTTTPTPTPTASVTDITTNVQYGDSWNGYYLTVRMEGEFDDTGITLLLSTPSGGTTGDVYIPEKRLLDGVETVGLDLPDPIRPGAYTIQVVRGDSWQGDPTLVAERTASVGEQQAEIKNTYIETSELEYQDGFAIDLVRVSFANTGEIPLPISDVTLAVGQGEETSLTGWDTEVLAAGDETSVSSDSTVSLPTLTAGINRLKFRVYSQKGEVASLSRTVNI